MSKVKHYGDVLRDLRKIKPIALQKVLTETEMLCKRIERLENRVARLEGDNE